MNKNKLKRIARSAFVIVVALATDTARQRSSNWNIVATDQVALVTEKRLARKELIESEAFKKAMPTIQLDMLRSLDR